MQLEQSKDAKNMLRLIEAEKLLERCYALLDYMTPTEGILEEIQAFLPDSTVEKP